MIALLRSLFATLRKMAQASPPKPVRYRKPGRGAYVVRPGRFNGEAFLGREARENWTYDGPHPCLCLPLDPDDADFSIYLEDSRELTEAHIRLARQVLVQMAEIDDSFQREQQDRWNRANLHSDYFENTLGHVRLEHTDVAVFRYWGTRVNDMWWRVWRLTPAGVLVEFTEEEYRDYFDKLRNKPRAAAD